MGALYQLKHYNTPQSIHQASESLKRYFFEGLGRETVISSQSHFLNNLLSHKTMHTFSLGPSGAGKSYLSEQLAEHERLVFIEADLWPPVDGMIHHGLKPQWDRFFLSCDPIPLLTELDQRAKTAKKSGIVLSFPGFPILRQKHIAAARGMFRIIYFEGSPGQCLYSFLTRERDTGRNLNISHWSSNIDDFFAFLASGEVAANTVSVFTTEGKKRPFREINNDISLII